MLPDNRVLPPELTLMMLCPIMAQPPMPPNNPKKAVIGQTEEKIYEYLNSIGVSPNKEKSTIALGIPYTKFIDIPKPDLAPLKKEFNPTFEETLFSTSRHINRLLPCRV